MIEVDTSDLLYNIAEVRFKHSVQIGQRRFNLRQLLDVTQE